MTIAATELAGIQHLQARYGHLVDAADWDGLRACFTDDAVLDLSSYGMDTLRGIDAVMRFYTDVDHPAAHHLTNVDPWRDGATVRCRTKWMTTQVDGRAAGGDYVDVLVAGLGGWRIQERVVVPRWRQA